MSEVAAVAKVCEEDQWRAGLYALIGRLFFEGPDVPLLVQLSVDTPDAESENDGPLAQAWRQLAVASASADATLLKHEHDRLFIGIGKTPVTPYTSAYVPGVSPERHLLLLRQQLEQWGLGRDRSTSMPEDHISGVCDALRHLILRGELIAVQKEFFNKFMYLQCLSLCKALTQAAPSPFYLEVARFTQAFLLVELEGFDMVSSAL